FYQGLIAGAVLAGFPLIVLGMQYNQSIGWESPYFFFVGSQFNYWGSIPVALGWVGVIMLLCLSGGLTWLRERLAAVGRTAFSNYILQTVIGTWIFYGHGLGLFGSVDRTGQALIVLAVWAFQLLISHWWLQQFRFGPLEWLWRTLVYLKSQPFRKVTA
ncbi:MAG: DUF418 domain-containing protein, partial [Rhodothermales bacterium]|nr:DUF418 domain-containing protein [Rhodothermales bacterium]